MYLLLGSDMGWALTAPLVRADATLPLLRLASMAAPCCVPCVDADLPRPVRATIIVRCSYCAGSGSLARLPPPELPLA